MKVKSKKENTRKKGTNIRNIKFKEEKIILTNIDKNALSIKNPNWHNNKIHV